MVLSEVIAELKSMADPDYLKQSRRYNVPMDNRLGVRAPNLHELATKIGTDHELALQLWESEWREARILTCLVADPDQVTEELMEEWVVRFDGWGICDAFCGCLFDRTPFAYRKALEWADREEEFVKRAGFTMMACLAVHDKEASDDAFLRFLPVIKAKSDDGRNFVKKAVNWALRQIGKRNIALNRAAIETAKEIIALDTKSARWIGKDALRELRSDKVQYRLHK